MMVLVSRVHNAKREESVLLQYNLYKLESQSYDAIPIVTCNLLASWSGMHSTLSFNDCCSYGFNKQPTDDIVNAP